MQSLIRDMILYTVFRLALVVVLAALLFGIGRLFVDKVAIVPVLLFAIVLALPLSMLLGKGLRNRVSRSAAEVDQARKARKDEFRKRLQGIEE